jgi:N6-L-threonylcarbamoyladenine synthase
MQDHGEVEWIGGTRDDAAGEAFDKSARLLGLTYPGGPQIAKHAKVYIDTHPDVGLTYFPRPIINEFNFDFSFSGLKTAVLYAVKNKKITDAYVNKVSAEVQEAIVDVLVTKTERAVRKYDPRSLLVAGGVSANDRLRNSLTYMIKRYDTKLFIPELIHCTDNATYIATFAYYNNHPLDLEKITAVPSLTITNEK